MVVDDLYKDAADNEVSTGFSFNADVLQRAIKNIYERKYNPNKEIDGHLLEEVHRIINAATDIGFSGREADGEFMRQLKSNNGVFAAFKTHRMGRDIASRLIDDNGEVKSFQQFQQDVEPITSHHIDRWLRTEYDTAIKRAQQAADMMQYREEADVLPNLEWLPSTAMKPREDHMVFYHHIWAIDDPFWQKHKPGDQWGCQCDLAPTDAPITDNEGLGGEPNAKPSKGLSGDPSRTGIIFSDDHPYFPSDCNHCVFNSNRFNIFRNKKKDCHQCSEIDNVKRKSNKKYRLIEKKRDAMSQICNLPLPSPVIRTNREYKYGIVMCSKSDIRQLVYHAGDVESVDISMDMPQYLEQLHFVDREDVKHPSDKKEDRNLKEYTVYRLEVGEHAFIVKCEARDKGKNGMIERPYSIYKVKK